MKTFFSLLLTLTMVTPALAQGKVNFINDSLHLVYWDPSLGTPFAGHAYAAGDGGQALTVELWAGTSSMFLLLQSSTDFTDQSAIGKWTGKTVTFPTIPGGPIFAKVYIYSTAAGSWEMATSTPGYWAGSSWIFSMNASSTIAYNSIVNHNWPAGSTWADGTYNLDSLSPGFRGAIMLGAGCDCEYYVGIYSQPGNQTVIRGGTATFAVGANVGCACVPLNYQWLFNGVPIPGATNQYYQIGNVQPANAGHYAVRVSDFYMAATSYDAILTVLPVPPAINSPPQSQTAELGTGVGFRVGATGDPPLVYQWLFNGTYAVSGVTTNPALYLTNLQFAQAGAYTVVVSNVTAAVTSPPALLNVIPVVERRPAAALNLTGVLNRPLNLDYTPLLDPPISWLSLDSVLLTNSSQQYIDASSVLAATRFYRSWQTNGPPSVLALNVVPAITLTGAIGSSVRLDYINQLGPIDAWVTNLATITLTNTSQLYFDTSAIGQPPRLWRIVPVP